MRLTHDGCQLYYLDAAGIVHLLLNGARGRTHSGDGWFFYNPEPKISEGRSVAMDDLGNMTKTNPSEVPSLTAGRWQPAGRGWQLTGHLPSANPGITGATA